MAVQSQREAEQVLPGINKDLDSVTAALQVGEATFKSGAYKRLGLYVYLRSRCFTSILSVACDKVIDQLIGQ